MLCCSLCVIYVLDHKIKYINDCAADSSPAEVRTRIRHKYNKLIRPTPLIVITQYHYKWARACCWRQRSQQRATWRF